ncbi:MAG: response regulator transcription factor [Cytophagaceae bacterium]|nr:response regulator transcription factor [Cytophagaceae bacterium]MDW8456863.1 response regulator transcription factor [Cytophagaceae bacterium]
MSTIRVVVADDHTVVRKGLIALFDNDPEIVVIGEAEDGNQALKQIQELAPDILLLDIAMPRMNGLELLSVMAKHFPATKTLVMSMYDNREYILKSIELGAYGYLLKDSSKDEIKKALKTIYTREKYFSPSIANIIVDGYIQKTKNLVKSAEDKNEKSILSRKEKIILKYLAQGLSSREIAEQLDLSVRTVEVHRARMMKKLQVKNAVELVKYAIQNKMV